MSIQVINRLGYSSSVIFVILFGFVISEHLRNMSEIILDQQVDIGRFFLSLSLFVYFLIMFVEAILYFDTYGSNIFIDKAKKNIILYLIWCFQFIPMYTMLSAISKVNAEFLQVISYSFVSIYFIYIGYVVFECFFYKEISIKDKIKTIRLYVMFCVVFGCYTGLKSSFSYNPIGLALLIIITKLFYIYHWKDFYVARLFEKKLLSNQANCSSE